MMKAAPTDRTRLHRTTFSTSRLLDFCSRKELIAQTGHQPDDWPLVIAKELLDNALDACEEAGVAPVIDIAVDDGGITVSDNGPGIPADTVAGVLDFSVRVSSREAYIAPDRGAQGNALKTIVAMPFVLDGERGEVSIAAQGSRHRIAIEVDRIRQEPKIDHQQQPDENVRTGTSVTVRWPDSATSILSEAEEQFLQFADDFTWLNPHLTLTVNWRGNTTRIEATAPDWTKWLPSNPTCPHWYEHEHFERLIAAYIAHDADRGQDRLVREVVREFRGLTGSAKQKAVLEATGLIRTHLSALVNGNGLDGTLTRQLLEAMQQNTRPVKPKALGIIGKDHFAQRFEAAGCDTKSFQYDKQTGDTDGVPWVVETVFGYCPQEDRHRRLVTGVNWSPGIVDPFRQLGGVGQSLSAQLSELQVHRHDPVIFVLHLVYPRVEYTDRGKSAVVIED